MTKKFTDPYAQSGDFNPVISRLCELGFFQPNCRIAADELHCIRTYSDGSNMLYDLVRKIPLALYDALEDSIFSVYLQINGEVVKPLQDAKGIWGHGGAFLIAYITLNEMHERVNKKEFRDVFK